MAIETEIRTTPALKEEIPTFILKAAKHVSVTDYLILRTRSRWVSNSSTDTVEWMAIYRADEAVQAEVKNRGKTFNLAGEVKFSVNPAVVGARTVLSKVPIEVYLVARHQVLEKAIDINVSRKNWLWENGGSNQEFEQIHERVENLVNEINITNKAINAIQAPLT